MAIANGLPSSRLVIMALKECQDMLTVTEKQKK